MTALSYGDLTRETRLKWTRDAGQDPLAIKMPFTERVSMGNEGTHLPFLTLLLPTFGRRIEPTGFGEPETGSRNPCFVK